MTNHGCDSDRTPLQGDSDAAIEVIILRHGDQLERMVRLRLDCRLCGRVDPADILQETYTEVVRRLHKYLADPSVPIVVWLRSVAKQVLVDVHRRHLGAQIRDARMEVSPHRDGSQSASSFSLAARFVSDLTSPSQAAMRDEMIDEVRAAFDRLDPVDREVLALRHFECLRNNEVAAILGLQKATASNRYVRALKRLRKALARLPSFSEFSSS